MTLKHDDTILEEAGDIKHHVISYFSDLYATSNSCFYNGLVDRIIPSIVSAEDIIMLTNLPSVEEVRLVVFSMNGEDAPGPDGYGGYFFQDL